MTNRPESPRLYSWVKVYVCLVLTLILLPATVQAQKYSFLSFSNNLGLPQSQVQAIAQDHEGYLWVGTLGGLAKFNGKRFSNFLLEQGLLNNRVSSLKVIGKQIWVGHQGGVSLIEGKKAKAWLFPSSEQNNNVMAIASFNNTIYVAVEGGGIYYKKSNRFVHIKLPNEDANICRALCVFNGKLMIGTRDGLYRLEKNNGISKVNALGSFSISGIFSKKDQLTVTTYNDGFFRSDKSLKTFTNLNSRDNLYISNALLDKGNRIWAVTDNGLTCWKHKGKYTDFSSNNGMPTSVINCVFEDADGTIWVGSDGKGLLRFCGEQWAYYNTSTNLPSDLIISCSKAQNNYIFGTYDQGAFSMDNNGKVQQLGLPATTVWCVESWEGKSYFGTDAGLFVAESGSTSYALIEDKVQAIHALYKSTKGLVVVGENEIGLIRKGKYTKISFSRRTWNRLGIVRTFIEYDGNCYLGSSNGLFRLDLNKAIIEEHKTFGSGVFTLCADDYNRLWIGTENGLYFFDGIVYKNFNLGKFSGSKYINFLEAIHDEIYVGTNNGLFLLSVDKTPMVMQHFGLNSGLINLETNINSSFFDQKYLWFGTAEGLVRFDVLDFNQNQLNGFNPTLISTAFNVNFEPFPFAFSSADGALTRELNLSYTKNNVSIDLDALFLQDPESAFIQYWVEGLDEKWSPPTSNSTVTLNNLPDGEFVLHIRAVNDFGMVSKNIDIPIYIRPPYYRTWWFYLLLAVVVILGIRYYFRWQLKRERDRNYQENLENRTRLIALEQQSLNASMNRHFIFNSLNSIQYFINTQDKHSANRYLSNFAKLIRKNLDSATENDNMVSLHQELERLELYLSLESMRFKDRFIYVIDTDDVETEQIDVPSMLLQPFVENSIIHGILPNEHIEGKIEIRLKVIGHQLEICIDDNGIGIDVSINKKASFSGDHKSKGMEITSKRISLIRTMLKKDYDLIGPFQIANPDHSIKGTRVLIKIPYENLEN